MRNWLAVGCCAALLAVGLAVPVGEAAQPVVEDWPRWDAYWTIEIVKDINAVPAPHEPSDLAWFHLHRNHPTLPDGEVNTIRPRIIRGYDELDPASAAIELQYLVRGIPVSPWLAPPFVFDLGIDNPGFAELEDGVHDLTFVARGADRFDFKPLPAFVHISRDKTLGEPFGFTTSVPIMNIVQGSPTSDWDAGPGVAYADPSERNFVGYPVGGAGTPWTTAPHETELYQEPLTPHTELFQAAQMWWDHPAHPGNSFVRGMTPQHGEDHRDLRVNQGHERFPMKDGPAGVGWISPYVSGQVDSQGRFAFAETGGRIGYLMPDGEVITIAGWRVQPGLDPVWWEKPTDVVRQNMENRGSWLGGRGEFRTPLDVAVDPRDESILYVAGYEDNVIWKVQVPDDPATGTALVDVFVGDLSHQAGYVDGSATDARFDGPASLVFDPVSDMLYVADQNNDAIRRIDRDGNVTTVAGRPGMQQRVSVGGADWTDQLASRSVSTVEVTAVEAAAGVEADVYLPQSIRVDSHGRIVFLEIGFGAVRRLDPATGETEILGEVQQKHRQFDRGWAWLDVDRWGNSGPLDGVYWTKFVNTLPGEHFSEVFRWLPPEGGDSFNLFSDPTGLYPDGWGRRDQTNPPHYGWLVAVDPRGGVLLSGGGEHGITRLRLQEPADPVQESNYWLGRQVWAAGSPLDADIASQSLALRNGWAGHNYLGLTDAWGLAGASDSELLEAFDVPASIRQDPDALGDLLAFIRPNTYRRPPSNLPPPPPPTPVPTVAPTPTPPPTSVLRCRGLVPDVITTPGVAFVGTSADEVILGTPGSDVIDGGGGDDTICGLGGDDQLSGGDGADYILGGSGEDNISGGAGRDRLFGEADDDEMFGDDGVDFVSGGPGDDIISGGFGVDRLLGDAGDDEMFGDGGSDFIHAGLGNDFIRAGSGADRVWAGPGDDTIFGMGGQDSIYGEDGNDTIQGNFQSDRLYGGPGDDVVRGAGGRDRIYGESGNDRLFGGDNTDFLDGGPGTDHADGQRGKDNPLVPGVSGCIAETVNSC